MDITDYQKFKIDTLPLLILLHVSELHLCECRVCDPKAHARYQHEAKEELRQEGFRGIESEERLAYLRSNKERIAREVREAVTAEEKEKMVGEAIAIAKQELLEEQRKRMSLLESMG